MNKYILIIVRDELPTQKVMRKTQKTLFVVDESFDASEWRRKCPELNHVSYKHFINC